MIVVQIILCRPSEKGGVELFKGFSLSLIPCLVSFVLIAGWKLGLEGMQSSSRSP